MYQPENVKLYVKPVCGWCRQAEHWLKSQGIEFETVDVIENPEAFEDMERISGQTLAPVIEVDEGFGQVVRREEAGVERLVALSHNLAADRAGEKEQVVVAAPAPVRVRIDAD